DDDAAIENEDAGLEGKVSCLRHREAVHIVVARDLPHCEDLVVSGTPVAPELCDRLGKTAEYRSIATQRPCCAADRARLIQCDSDAFGVNFGTNPDCARKLCLACAPDAGVARPCRGTEVSLPPSLVGIAIALQRCLPMTVASDLVRLAPRSANCSATVSV